MMRRARDRNLCMEFVWTQCVPSIRSLGIREMERGEGSLGEGGAGGEGDFSA
jgi:hypothetical protein